MLHKVSNLLDQFSADHGQRAGRDRFLLWLEQCYSRIRALPWSWNMELSLQRSFSVKTPVPTFKWAQGNSAIETDSGGASGLALNDTGRYVRLGDFWYQVRGVGGFGLAGANTVLLDRPIVEPTASIQTLSFFRRDFSVKSTGIQAIYWDKLRLVPITDEQIYRFVRGIDPRWKYETSDIVVNYHVDQKYKLPTPIYPPVEHAALGGVGPSAGDRHYFWCYEDPETGLLSDPGPLLVHTSTGQGYTFRFGPVISTTPELTFNLVLFRSQVLGEYTRPTMYEVGTGVKTIGETTVKVNDTLVDSDLPEKVRYYDGPWLIGFFYPAPSDIRALEISHIRGWGRRPDQIDWLEFGTQEELLDLFSLYITVRQSAQDRKPVEMRAAQIAFIDQLNYLLGEDRPSMNLDPSTWDYEHYSPILRSYDDDQLIRSVRYPF